MPFPPHILTVLFVVIFDTAAADHGSNHLAINTFHSVLCRDKILLRIWFSRFDLLGLPSVRVMVIY